MLTRHWRAFWRKRYEKSIYSFLFCILLIQSVFLKTKGYVRTKNELNIFDNLNSPEVIINNIQIEDDKSQMLINEFNNSRRKGLTKCLCLFEIETKTDNGIITSNKNNDEKVSTEWNTKNIELSSFSYKNFIYSQWK